MTAPRLSGIGNLQQLGALVAVLAGWYSIQNTHHAEAAVQGAQAAALKYQEKVDDQFSARFQRIWDYLPALRRDIEADYRRDVDSACRCCKP